MSKKKSVYKALPIVAATYGEKFGVKVLVGNDDAYTDGDSITIPNVPDDYPNMDAVWGYLAHEAAHIRFTDFDSVRQWGEGTKRALANIIEDSRIERAMMDVYPGTTQTLHETTRYGVQANHYQMVDDQCTPGQILTGFCLYWLRAKAIRQTVLDNHLASAESAMRKVFPQGVVVKLNALIRKALDVKSTQEALALAEDILTMIEEEKEKEENKPQDQPPQDGQSGNDSDQQQDQNQDSSGAGSDSKQDQDDSGSSSDSRQGQGGDQDSDSGSDSDSKQDQSQQNRDKGSSSDDADSDQSKPTPSQSSGGSGQRAADVLQQVLDATDDELPQDVQSALKEELSQLADDSGDNSRPLDIQSDEMDAPHRRHNAPN